MSQLPTSSPGWQWQQTQQRFSEWFEQLLSRPAKPTQRPRGNWSWAWLEAIAPYITITLCVILALFILYILVRSISAWRLQRQRRRAMAEAIPLELETPVSQSEWLTRAQQYQRQGNFTEAARALYFALLQILHDRGLIPEKRSRTDREYAAITQDLPQPNAFATLLQTHEQLEFAGSQVSAEGFAQCQQAYNAAAGAIAKAQAPANVSKANGSKPSRGQR